MTRKKILYIITKSNFGGAQRYVYELATHLPKDRYDVVVAFGGSGLLKEKLEDAGITTRCIESFERDVDIKREFSSWRELHALIRKERPDIVHLNSSKAGGSGALIARLCGVEKIVFTAHGWPFYERRSAIWRSIVWFLSYITTLLATDVIVVSAHDQTHARMPGLLKRIIHIPTALPALEFKTRDEARKELCTAENRKEHAHDVWFVSTGEHTANKNLAFLLRAFSTLKARWHTNFFLTLMSDGELRPELEHLTSTLGLSSHVHFTGYVPDARLYLQAFDVFVIPSHKEGFPYGLLEAGAAGLAAIGSSVGGIPEIINHTVNGELIDPANETELSDALLRFLTSPGLRRTYGDALQKKIKTEFTLMKMLHETMNVYESNLPS